MAEAYDVKVNIRFEGTEPSRETAISGSASRLLTKALGQDELGKILWPEVSDIGTLRNEAGEIQLKLIPLSRIGQMEGKTGSLVLVGYFALGQNSTSSHSNPIVVKTSLKSESDRLHDEFRNAESIKALIADSEHFALPIEFDPGQAEFDVLWSIFVPQRDIGAARITDLDKLKNDDLRRPLKNGEHAIAKEILDVTYDRLKALHCPLACELRKEREIGEEYDWYLRVENPSWADEWQEIWGGNEITRVKDAGGNFANPFCVLEKIKQRRISMRCGAIHGDLHPGNIVLKGGEPHLIDFGWAQRESHVAKDFVLMECNLRFHTLKAPLRQADIYDLADWVKWDAEIPDNLSGYVRERAELIQHVRHIAKNVLANGNVWTVDWDWEYIVPLFMVAFGMMRFAPQLGNQTAALRFVLALADLVDELVEVDAE